MNKPSEYSNEWALKAQAAKLESIIDSGLGLTNKPIPAKRMATLKRNLAEIKTKLLEHLENRK